MIDRAVLEIGRLDPQASENGSKRSKLPRGSVTLFSPLSRSALPTRPSTSSGLSDVWPGFLGSARLATLPPSMASSGKSPISPVTTGSRFRRLEPGLERRPALFGQAVELGLGGLDLRFDRRDRPILLGRGQEQGRGRNGIGEVRVEPRFIDAVEEAEELIIFFLGDRIVLVAVAAGAFESQPQERGREGVGPVGDVLDAELFLDASPLVGLAMVAVEGRGEDLRRGSAGAAGRRPVAR